MKNDITKCLGKDCPIKEKCYRFIVEPDSINQSYFSEIPGKWKTDILLKEVWECEMFWGDTNQSILNQLKSIMK